MKIQTILCPTDFSEPADHALAAAQSLAQQFDARLVVVHVIEPMQVVPAPQVGTTPAFDVAHYLGAMREHGERMLSEQVVAMRAAGIDADWRLAEGSVADKVVELAVQEEADLIVIATHGRSGFKRFFLGSVADRVVHHATCPVLTIKEPR
jgi:nucleotide-binding universal stress UspA family protein